ncbi:BnaC01g28770D [Brassica napus]|uniref:BnaC01g28770D protein n=1 Tax=Brassica napus TaxID=3708 RepID=A0A078H947_BRANA|nr:BnaC01g28770D [Brassica napus]
MDEPTSGMQGLPPLLFLGHHIFKSVDEATEGVPDGHYPATWKLDVTIFSRKCREHDQ